VVLITFAMSRSTLWRQAKAEMSGTSNSDFSDVLDSIQYDEAYPDRDCDEFTDHTMVSDVAFNLDQPSLLDDSDFDCHEIGWRWLRFDRF
jgi:hypothetical protein